MKEKLENIFNDDSIRISKFLSLILRHSPQTIHLNMDSNGWVNIDEIIHNAKKYKNIILTLDLIKIIVENNDKKRFKIFEDEKKIRASQGHSIKVNLNLENKPPPDVLYHGTANRFLESIMENGIEQMNRQYVHLSQSKEIALTVGKRHGKPIVLVIDAKNMLKDGYKFYLSENNIWLTDKVPVKYIKPLNEELK